MSPLRRLDQELAWHHFHRVLHCQTVTGLPRVRGGEIDPTSQGVKCQRIYGYLSSVIPGDSKMFAF